MGSTLLFLLLVVHVVVVQWVALNAIVVAAAAAGSSAHTPPPYGGGTSSSSSSSTSQPQPQPPQTLPRSTNRRYSSSSADKNNNNNNNKSSYSLYNHNNYDDDPNHQHPGSSDRLLPPWNPSPYIDPQTGFLQGVFVRTPGVWEQEEPLRTRHTLDAPCRIRQVPGDGNCLFHSISLCLCEAVNGTQWNLSPHSATTTDTSSLSSSSGTSTSSTAVSHGGGGSGNMVRTSPKTTTTTQLPPPPPSLAELYAQSHKLRADAVACLRDKRRRLILQGRDRLRADDLVQAAAQQYGMTPEDYCQAMQQDCVWGGGPEIVALCNLLQRPIHVYELATAEAVHLEQQQLQLQLQQQANQKNSNNDSNTMDNNPPAAALTWDENRRRCWLQQRGATGCGTTGFVLRRMACFGSPRFDRQKALHILSADSRFPDLQPGQQLPAGNHFLAVFPDEGLLQQQQQRDSDDSPNDKDKPGGSLWRRSRKRLRGGDWSDDNPQRTAGSSEISNSGMDRTNGEFAGVPSDSFLRRAQSRCRQWWSSVWYLS